MSSQIISKIERGKFYLAPSDTLVRTLRVDERHNRVIFKRYDSFNNDFLDLDLAQRIWTPMFKIGEVASFVGKKSGTLRKYENQGVIPPARQFYLNINKTKKIRLYSRYDIMDIVQVMDTIRPPGRPGPNNTPAKLNREHINTRLSRRFDTFNNE